MPSQSLSEEFLRAALPSVPKRMQGALPRNLYRYVWRTSARQQWRLIALSLAVFPLTLVPLELQRRIIDTAIAQKDLVLVLWFGLAYLAVVLLHASLKYALNVYQGRVSEGIIRLLRRRVARFGDKREDGGETGASVSMMAAEAERVGGFVGEALFFPLLHGGIVVAVVAYMLVVQPLLALIAIGLLALTIAWAPPLLSRINRAAEDWTRELRELGDEVAGEDAALDRLDASIDELYASRNRFYVVKFVYKGLNNLIGHLGPLGILMFGGWMVIEGRTEIGTIVAFISGFERIVNPARQFLGFYRRLSQMRVQYRLVRQAVPGRV